MATPLRHVLLFPFSEEEAVRRVQAYRRSQERLEGLIKLQKTRHSRALSSPDDNKAVIHRIPKSLRLDSAVTVEWDGLVAMTEAPAFKEFSQLVLDCSEPWFGSKQLTVHLQFPVVSEYKETFHNKIDGQWSVLEVATIIAKAYQNLYKSETGAANGLLPAMKASNGKASIYRARLCTPHGLWGYQLSEVFIRGFAILTGMVVVPFVVP